MTVIVQDRGEEGRMGVGANGRGVSEALDGATGLRAASALSMAASTLQRSKSLAAADREVQSEQFSALKEQLDHSEEKVQALIASNDDMRSELAKLNSTVQRLVHDNKELQRSSLSPPHSHDSPQHAPLLRGQGEGASYEGCSSPHPQLPPSHASPLRSPQSPGSRSHSMYEYRDPNSRPPTGPTSLPCPSNYSPRSFPRRDSFNTS